MSHMASVICHVSRVICIFLTNWQSYLMAGLLSTGPTPSSLLKPLFEKVFEFYNHKSVNNGQKDVPLVK